MRFPNALGHWICCAGLILANATDSHTAAREAAAPAYTIVAAHRGDHTAAHENSLEAIESAIRAGADYVELDVRATRDGELALMHDATVDRTTDGHGTIADLRWTEVQSLMLADRQRTNLAPAKVPSLAEALGVLQGRAGLYLDFKSGNREQVVHLLRRYQMVASTIVYDDREAMGRWKELEPALRTMTSPEPEDLSIDALATLKQRLQIDILDGPASVYTPTLVREIQNRGLPVWPDIQGPWENPQFWDQVMSLRAAGYQTDRPADFIEFLRQRGYRDRLEHDRGAIIRGRPDRRQLALVFTGHEYADGGEVVLRTLAERRIRAGFFLTGSFLEQPAFEPLVRRMVREGHYVGPHSDQHMLYCGWERSRPTLLSREEFREDLEANIKRLARFGVERTAATHFLPPYEHHNEEVAAWTREAGLVLINHTPGTRSAADYTGDADANYVASSAIVESLLQREHERGLNGWILLFHLGAGPARSDPLHRHLGGLLDELARRGYAFLRVDEMLADQPPRRNVFVRLNQLGYRPGDVKRAVAFSAGLLGDAFEVVDQATGQIVFEGPVRTLAGGWGRFDSHGELDFTSLIRPGHYRLRIDGTESELFQVGKAVGHGLPAQMLGFLRQQRCGYNPWLDTECHQADGRTAFGPRAPGTRLDARGGWHDAADLLKYLLTSGNATAQLLLAWELHRPTADAAAMNPRERLFPDRVDTRGVAGTNGVPDLLDEARWGLEWMLKLHPTSEELYHQVADDRDHYGLRLPHQDQADYGWGRGGDRVVYCADGQPQGLGRFPSDSTGLANLAGRYAAAMALAWQIWKDDPAHAGFAQRCLQSGREVYALGRRMEGVQQGNSYGIGVPFIWCSNNLLVALVTQAQLYQSMTGDRRYEEFTARHRDWLFGRNPWGTTMFTGVGRRYPTDVHLTTTGTTTPATNRPWTARLRPC